MDDNRRMLDLERRIEAGRTGMLDAALALTEVRDSELYLKFGYKTFDEYCRKRWHKSWAYRLIAFAEVKKSPMATNIANEAQAREIKVVPEEKQADVIKGAQALAQSESRPMTARDIKAAAQQEFGPAVASPKCGPSRVSTTPSREVVSKTPSDGRPDTKPNLPVPVPAEMTSSAGGHTLAAGNSLSPKAAKAESVAGNVPDQAKRKARKVDRLPVQPASESRSGTGPLGKVSESPDQATCKHKFVDSKSCLKCGWTPPPMEVSNDTMSISSTSSEEAKMNTPINGATRPLPGDIGASARQFPAEREEPVHIVLQPPRSPRERLNRYAIGLDALRQICVDEGGDLDQIMALERHWRLVVLRKIDATIKTKQLVALNGNGVAA